MEKAKNPISISKAKAYSKEYIPKEFKNVAQGMEEQFLRFLIEQMKKSIDREKPEGSAMNYYNSVLDQERAKTMSKTNEGLGIQQLILDQIYPRQYRNKENYQLYQQQAQALEKPTNKSSQAHQKINNRPEDVRL